MADGMSRNWFFGLSSRVLMLIVAGLLVLSYLTIAVNPAKAWVVTLLGLLFIPLSFVNFLLILWALKRRSKAVAIPLMAFLPALLFLGRYFQFGGNDDISHDGLPMKVVSYNVGAFSQYEKDASVEGRQQCADSVFAFLLAQNADVICLQEFHVEDINKVKQYLRKHFKGYKAEYFINHQNGHGSGNVTLSRFPVKDKGVITFEESANLALYTDYEVESRLFRVYNCHFQSYGISFNGMVRAISENDEEAVAATGRKVKKSILLRPKQVNQVFDHIESCPMDSFVCGDFNDNPMSYTYQRMIRDRKDSFREAGRGFGATFSLLWPMLRIDYVLFPDHCEGLSYQVPRLPFSDHYPVVTEISI